MRGPVALQIIILGAILSVCGLVALLTVALASGAMGTLLSRHPLWLKTQNAVTGSLMIGLAIFLIANERR
jgi:threonine/homoserine/homoserine lactone efflux protein